MIERDPHEAVARRRKHRARRGRASRAATASSGLWWLLASLYWPSLARAQLDLEWSAPPECPDRASVLVLVESQLPERLRTATTLYARAQVKRAQRGYRLELQLSSDASMAERSLANRECDALARAAALLLALAVESAPEEGAVEREPSPSAMTGDPAARSVTVEPRAASTSQEERRAIPPEPSSAETRASSSTPAPGASRRPPTASSSSASSGEHAIHSAPDGPTRLQLGAGAALRLDAGMLSASPAWGLQPRLTVRFARVHASLGVTFWLRSEERAERYAAALLRSSGIVADATLGISLLDSRLSLLPSIGLEYGRIEVASQGISEPGVARAPWLAAGGGMSATLRVAPHLELALEAAVLAPFERPRWLLRTASGDVAAFTSSRLVLRASLAAAFLFD